MEIIASNASMVNAEFKDNHTYINVSNIAKRLCGSSREAVLLLQKYNRKIATKEYKIALKNHLDKVVVLPTLAGNSLIYNSINKKVKIEYKLRGYKGIHAWKNGTWFHVLLIEDFLKYSLPAKNFCDLKFNGVFNTILKQESYKSVYIFESTNGFVKIGISNNVKNRVKQVKNASGRDILRVYSTPLILTAYSIEQALLDKFSKNIVHGEWINGVSFKRVVNTLINLINKSEFKLIG